MARDLDDVLSNYRHFARQFADGRSAVLDPGLIQQRAEHQRAAVERARALAGRVTAVLQRCGVGGDTVRYYLAYAQQLDRVPRKYSCLVLANEAGHFTDYWLNWGLEPGVVEQVCRAVLGFFPRPLARPCSACDRRRGCRLRREPVTIL